MGIYISTLFVSLAAVLVTEWVPGIRSVWPPFVIWTSGIRTANRPPRSVIQASSWADASTVLQYLVNITRINWVSMNICHGRCYFSSHFFASIIVQSASGADSSTVLEDSSKILLAQFFAFPVLTWTRHLSTHALTLIVVQSSSWANAPPVLEYSCHILGVDFVSMVVKDRSGHGRNLLACLIASTVINCASRTHAAPISQDFFEIVGAHWIPAVVYYGSCWCHFSTKNMTSVIIQGAPRAYSSLVI